MENEEKKNGTVTAPVGATVKTNLSGEPVTPVTPEKPKGGRPTKEQAEAKKAAANAQAAPQAKEQPKGNGSGTPKDDKAPQAPETTLADKILNSDENGRPLQIQCSRKNRICAPEYIVVRAEGAPPEHVCRDCVGAASSYVSCEPYYRGV